MKKMKIYCAVCDHLIYAVKGHLPAHSVEGRKLGKNSPTQNVCQGR